jgi:hypothetical protein
MPIAKLYLLVQVFSLIGSLLVVFRLLATGLYSRYRVFFLYFLFRIPNGLWPLLFANTGSLYFYFWIATEPFTWVFHIAVVLELYRLVLEKHGGLYTLGRWALYAGMGISITVSILSLLPKLKNAGALQSKTMGYYLAAERGVTLGLAIFLVFMVFFLTRYPIPMSRNLIVHIAIYTAFFFSNFLAWLLRSVFGLKVNAQVNLLLGAVSAVCVYLWFFLLTPKGEEVPANLPSFGPAYEKRALQQLESLNATLLKVSWK